MINYLNYVGSVVEKINDRNIVNKLNKELMLYKQYWNRYYADESLRPIYFLEPKFYDYHDFYFPTGEQCTIRWDIDCMYKQAKIKENVTHLSLREFDVMTEFDRLQSQDEFLRISKKVTSIQKHRYDEILILDFVPLHFNLILDGRHRYMEHKKFNPNTIIKTFILNSNHYLNCIYKKRDFINYIILHNINEINNFILGKSNLEQMINIEKCIN